MKNFRILLSLFVGVFFLLEGYSQELLTLEMAVKSALEKNHQVKMASNRLRMAQNSATPGNAGLLPKVDLTGDVSYGNTLTNTDFTGQIPSIENQIANSNSQSASVAASYVLFNGLGTVHTYRKLKEQAKTADIQLVMAMETTLVQVVAAYYEVVRAKENYEISKKNAELSLDRYERAQTRSDLGAGNSLEELSARVDLNTDNINVKQAQLQLQNARRNVNFLIGKPIDFLFDPESLASPDPGLDFKELSQKAQNNNIAILLAAQSVNLSQMDLKILRSSKYPRLDLSAGYGYNRSQNDASIVLQNQGLGLNVRLGMNFNIYNGRKQKILTENSILQIQNDMEALDEAQKMIHRDVSNTFNTYQNALNILESEKVNLELAEKNLQLARDRAQLGQINNTQLREAQLNLTQIKSRIVNETVTALLTEIELQRLAGGIMEVVN